MDANELIAKHSKLFPDGKALCGVEIGQGWMPLVDQLCDDLEKYDPAPTVDQIKEKWGALRFYVSLPFERLTYNASDIFMLVNEAENQSIKICEYCGNPGELRRRAWIKTLCEECNKRG